MRKNISKFAIAAAMVLVGLQAPASALTVTTNTNASDLVNSIIGSGINISNVTFSGGSTAAGVFNNGVSSGIGINSGIILSSGNVTDAVGPNNSDGTSTSFGLVGDGDLNSLIPGYTTHDPAVLEFDFTTTSGNLFFNYVFASEEYNEYVNTQYNDVFGFFVDGTNIALLPGGSTPVAINTVNAGSNPSLFNNNDPSDTSTPFDIEYDGFTDVLVAQALGLDTSKSHHIKIAIADAGDFVLDSSVFIQGGSFSVAPTDPGDLNNPSPAPEPSSMVLGMLALSGAMGLKKRKAC